MKLAYGDILKLVFIVSKINFKLYLEEVKLMKITKVAKAGTLESSDILIMVAPNEEGKIEIELESIVIKQFGDQIKKVIEDTLKELNAEGVTLKAQDKGALDYTIKARVETAIKRAM